MPTLNDLKVKLFADGADLETMINMANLDYIKGLTTNPTLMRKAGITEFKTNPFPSKSLVMILKK